MSHLIFFSSSSLDSLDTVCVLAGPSLKPRRKSCQKKKKNRQTLLVLPGHPPGRQDAGLTTAIFSPASRKHTWNTCGASTTSPRYCLKTWKTLQVCLQTCYSSHDSKMVLSHSPMPLPTSHHCQMCSDEVGELSPFLPSETFQRSPISFQSGPYH